jgi:hypothetical protein
LTKVAADPERDVTKVLLAVVVGAEVRGVTNTDTGNQKADSEIVVFDAP